MRAPLAALFFALLAGTPTVSAAPPGSPPAADKPAPAAVRAGSEIVFHGWSPDSRYVAYTRARRGKGPTRKEQSRLHRRVLDGRFEGFGTMVGGDVAAHAEKHGYRVEPAPWRRTSETSLELGLGATHLDLEFDVGRHHGWRLIHEGVVLAEHRFDRIYVGFAAELFVSPDMAQGVLVMHLDSGWDTDAAAYPVDLRAVTNQRTTSVPD